MADKKIPGKLLQLVKRADGSVVDASEVLDWREYDTEVVVVTTDGQKLTGAKG
jgi:hypothetical protein